MTLFFLDGLALKVKRDTIQKASVLSCTRAERASPWHRAELEQNGHNSNRENEWEMKTPDRNPDPNEVLKLPHITGIQEEKPLIRTGKSV